VNSRKRSTVFRSFERLVRAPAERAAEAYRADKRYYRGLIVRAIEDAVVLFAGGAAVWAICWTVSGIFQALGVAG